MFLTRPYYICHLLTLLIPFSDTRPRRSHQQDDKMKAASVAALLVLLCIIAQGQATKCLFHPEGECIDMNKVYCAIGNTVSQVGCPRGLTCCIPHVQKVPEYKDGEDQCGVPFQNTNDKIVGGKTTSIFNHPWMVSIQKRNQHVCGGSLINNQWILTAAHCLDTNADLITAVIGTSYTSRITYQRWRVTGHYIHGKYDKKSPTLGYDIALLKLEHPITLGSKYERRICLPDKHESFVDHVCVATGWGYMHEPVGKASTKGSSVVLRQAILPILSNRRCKWYKGGQMPPGTLCAGYKMGGEDACQGDSGGPLVCQDQNGYWKQAGIVSTGKGCARKYTMGTYTDVAAFTGWINFVIKNF